MALVWAVDTEDPGVGDRVVDDLGPEVVGVPVEAPELVETAADVLLRTLEGA